MIKIRLFCNQGMSTSLLVSKMRQAAAEEGLEADIMAFPVNDLDENLGEWTAHCLGLRWDT